MKTQTGVCRCCNAGGKRPGRRLWFVSPPFPWLPPARPGERWIMELRDELEALKRDFRDLAATDADLRVAFKVHSGRILTGNILVGTTSSVGAPDESLASNVPPERAPKVERLAWLMQRAGQLAPKCFPDGALWTLPQDDADAWLESVALRFAQQYLQGNEGPEPRLCWIDNFADVCVVLVERLIDQVAAAPADVLPLRETKPATAHGDDYRSVYWYGTDYSFTANQAAVVKVLWEHWQRGAPEVGDATLLKAVDHEAPPPRLNVLFRGHSAWGCMIVEGQTRGSHRLQEPSE